MFGSINFSLKICLEDMLKSKQKCIQFKSLAATLDSQMYNSTKT